MGQLIFFFKSNTLADDCRRVVFFLIAGFCSVGTLSALVTIAVMLQRFALLSTVLLFSTSAFSIPQSSFELSLHDAEAEALKTSSRLKASASDFDAASEQASAGFSTLLPRLALQGNYQYLSTVPTLAIAHAPPIELTTHTSYSVGPVLSYTFWDNFSALHTYKSLNKFAEARHQDHNNAELQLLLVIRSAYIRVQLALEELRLVNGSLNLFRAQDHDISTRFRAGAAARLDLVTSSRQVLAYELQFKQKQADLSSALKDLIALLSPRDLKDVSHPGPPDVEDVSLVLKFDLLTDTLHEQSKSEIPPPDEKQPMLRSQELLAESAEQSAAGQTAKIFPTLAASASSTLNYPNGPVHEQIHQNTVAVSLSLPLYLGDPSWHLAAEKRREAEAARYREDQLRTDLLRDFSKAHEMLESLREQQKLAVQDVAQSEESAKLYYSSYKAGKSNLIDVQTAHNAALQAKVSAARIDAQILNQLITLKALSGKEGIHD